MENESGFMELESKKLINKEPSPLELAAFQLIRRGSEDNNLTTSQQETYREVLGYIEASLSYAVFKRVKNKDFETRGIAREHEIRDYLYLNVYGEDNPFFTQEDIMNKIQEMKNSGVLGVGGPNMDLVLLQKARSDEHTPYFPEWIKKRTWLKYMETKTQN